MRSFRKVHKGHLSGCKRNPLTSLPDSKQEDNNAVQRKETLNTTKYFLVDIFSDTAFG